MDEQNRTDRQALTWYMTAQSVKVAAHQAQQEAEHRGHAPQPIHLLDALARQEKTALAVILERVGVRRERLLESTRSFLDNMPLPTDSVDPSTLLRRVIGAAINTMRGEQQFGSGHIALGMLIADSEASGKVLSELGISREAIHAVSDDGTPLPLVLDAEIYVPLWGVRQTFESMDIDDIACIELGAHKIEDRQEIGACVEALKKASASPIILQSVQEILRVNFKTGVSPVEYSYIEGSALYSFGPEFQSLLAKFRYI